MNERPTPETDAHIAECGYEYEGAGDMIDQAYARKMERERDEAREVAIGLAEQAERLRKERDDAWACCDELVVDSNAITLAKTVMRLESERDEAREKIERQAERIRHLEGATNHACGTPLSVALRERDKAREDATNYYARIGELEQERDEAREDLDEETKFHHRTHSELVQTQCKLMDVKQAIIATLEENRHLADGDDCTLAKLKSVVPEWE